jgi:uncharacterized membrane protein
MRSNRAAWIVFGLAFTAMAVALATTYPDLPERVASHFNLRGEPDGWMPRRSYMLFLGAAGLGIPWLLIAATRFVRTLPPSMVNVPHRDYWMTVENREEVYRATERLGMWVATGEVLFFILVHLSVVHANQVEPVRLPMDTFWAGLAAFLLTLTAMVAMYYLRFLRLPDKAARKRS